MNKFLHDRLMVMIVYLDRHSHHWSLINVSRYLTALVVLRLMSSLLILLLVVIEVSLHFFDLAPYPSFLISTIAGTIWYVGWVMPSMKLREAILVDLVYLRWVRERHGQITPYTHWWEAHEDGDTIMIGHKRIPIYLSLDRTLQETFRIMRKDLHVPGIVWKAMISCVISTLLYGWEVYMRPNTTEIIKVGVWYTVVILLCMVLPITLVSIPVYLLGLNSYYWLGGWIGYLTICAAVVLYSMYHNDRDARILLPLAYAIFPGFYLMAILFVLSAGRNAAFMYKQMVYIWKGMVKRDP